MADILIRPSGPEDRGWIDELMRSRYAAEILVTRGHTHLPSSLPGFIAIVQGARAGLITLRFNNDDCEVISLDSLQESRGVGTALTCKALEAASSKGCRRLWLITTNDNLRALGFYQKRGFSLVAVHRNALETTRRIKPTLPLWGMDGIPLRDEIELEMELHA